MGEKYSHCDAKETWACGIQWGLIEVELIEKWSGDLPSELKDCSICFKRKAKQEQINTMENIFMKTLFRKPLTKQGSLWIIKVVGTWTRCFQMISVIALSSIRITETVTIVRVVNNRLMVSGTRPNLPFFPSFALEKISTFFFGPAHCDCKG